MAEPEPAERRPRCQVKSMQIMVLCMAAGRGRFPDWIELLQISIGAMQSLTSLQPCEGCS